jgi:O-antigen/teichoic acid export membrane protein
VSKQTRERVRPGVRNYIRSWSSTRDLSRTASKVSFASGLDYIAGIVVQFVINPVLVAGLGSYLYGAWRVLYSLNGYLWATGGRSAQALTWAIAHGQRTLNEEEKRRYVGSAIVVWFLFLPFLLVVGALVAWFAPIYLHAPPEYVWDVRVAAALLTADAIALTLLSVPRSVLQGENLGYKRMGLSAALILLSGGFFLLAMRWDTGIVGVAVANVAGTTVTGLLFWQVTRSNVGWFGFARPTRKDIRWFFGLSAWFAGWKFVYELLTAGDVIVLGVFGSVELVTVYTLTKFVSQALVPLIAVLFEGSSPGLGAIIGSGNHPRSIRLRDELMAFSWIICTALGVALLVWNRSFVDLWVGARFYAGPVAMLLIVVMVTQFVFLGNDARIIDLTLQMRAKVLIGAISAVLSVVLAAVAMSFAANDIIAMCVGIIAGRLVLTVAYPLIVGRLLGDPVWRQLRGIPRPAITTVVLFAVSMRLGERLTANTWVELIVWGGATAVAVAVAAAFVGMTASQRTALIARVRKILHGGRSDRPTPSPEGAST